MSDVPGGVATVEPSHTPDVDGDVTNALPIHTPLAIGVVNTNPS